MSNIFTILTAVISPHERKYIGLVVLCLLLSAVLETVSIGGISPLVAVLSDPTGSATDSTFLGGMIRSGTMYFGAKFVFVLAMGLFVVFLAKSAFLYFLVIYTNKFIFRNQAKTEARLYKGYLDAPYIYHVNMNTADLIRNVKIEVSAAFNSVIRSFLTVVTDVVTVAVIVGFLIFVSPVITLISIAGLCLTSFLFSWALKKKLSRFGIIRQESMGCMIKWINQGLGGIKEIKVLGCEDYFENVFSGAAQQSATVEASFASLTQIPRLYFEMLAVTGTLVLMVGMFWYGTSAGSVFPLMAMFAFAGLRLMPSINRVLSNITNMRYNYPALELVYRELDRFDRKTDIEVSAENPHIISKPGLWLCGVGFQYPTADIKALHHVTLHIGEHEAVGIIGRTGAGKTTLINLILGLIAPTEGYIALEGVPIQDVPSRLGRNYAGYVPQEIYLLDDTVRRNIAYGLDDDKIDDNRVWEVLKLARLDDFIARSPQGLDAMVGERGVRISGGQKQRLGIARALYTNPRLLVFDEPTSALDTATEKDIIASIKDISSDKMVIIVTHRHGLLDQCHRVYKIEDGYLRPEHSHPPVLTESNDSIRGANP